MQITLLYSRRAVNECLGQLVNVSKSCFLVSPRAPATRKSLIHKLTGFPSRQFLVRYLGCPMFVGRKRKTYFTHIIDAVVARIQQWSARWLSIGARVILIKSVLSAMPVYLLSV